VSGARVVPRRAGAALAALLALAAARPASAQNREPEPEYFSPGGSWLARASLSPYGDLRLRYDRVEDRPGATETLERVRGLARGGLVWSRTPVLAIEAGFYSGLWKAKDDVLAEGFDNEKGGEWDVDRMAAVIAPVPDLTLVIGRRALPFETTDMNWDADLRPVGASAVLRRAVGTYDEARVAAAVVRREHIGDDDALVAAQAIYALRPGAARGALLAFGYFDYTKPDPLAQSGLGRQNRVQGTGASARYASRFRTIDAQLTARGRVAALPVGTGVHALRNLENSGAGDGLRAWATVGELREWPRLELRYVYQRIEREALPGAYNSDDWWFHSRARGHRLTLAARPWPRATFRISGFHEQRDDVSKSTRRLIAEMELRLLPD
jgi:hypothetical protein